MTKIGTEVAHVTRDSGTTFRVKRPKVKVTRPLYSPPCWRVRRLQGTEGGGILWRPLAQLVVIAKSICLSVTTTPITVTLR